MMAPALSATPPRVPDLFPWRTLPRCGIRGGALLRDLGAGIGRERGDREGEELERERLIRGSPTPGHARWSSASWLACVSDVGRWHWTHSAVARGSRAMNCSRTTRSTTSSTLRSSAISHLRQASRSCWAITKGRPLSPSSTERKH